jgi:RNA polymerase sigma-70 factor (ECF subfamily)
MLTTFNDQNTETFRWEPAAARRAMGDTTDNELMERIQSRDERALEMLIKRFQALVRSVVERVIPNDQDVSDVVEEVFLGIWKQAANFDSLKGNPIGWIITIARRRAIDRARRRQACERAELRFRDLADTRTSQYAGDDVEESAMKTEMAVVFQKLLSALPTAQSAAVRMAFYRGLSQREIARETGIPLGTIKTRLELGVKKLREAVTAIGSREEWLFGTL